MANYKLVIVIIFASISVFASGGAHGEEIPFGKIGIQAINLGILLVALVYFTKNSIAEAFSKRQSDFHEKSKQTESALLAAEAELKDVKNRIADLESGEQQAILKARAEAEAQKNKLIAEAGVAAKKINDDVALVVSAELFKVKNEIRKEIIEASIENAKISVKQSAATITQKSEKGFIADLGRVNS